jgi:hypothetical protein
MGEVYRARDTRLERVLRFVNLLCEVTYAKKGVQLEIPPGWAIDSGRGAAARQVTNDE